MMLAFLYAIPVLGPALRSIVSNLMMALICASVVIVTNGVTGVVAYVKGHNAAAAKCKLNTVIRERDEARRDLSVQKDTSQFYKLEVDRLAAADLQRKLKEGEYAVTVKPIDGCVVSPDPRGLRRERARR